MKFEPEELDAIADALCNKMVEMQTSLVWHQKKDDGQERDFTVETLAEHLGVPIRKIYEMTRKREVPFYKVGIKLRFRPTDIAKWKFATYIPAVNGQFFEKEGEA